MQSCGYQDHKVRNKPGSTINTSTLWKLRPVNGLISRAVYKKLCLFFTREYRCHVLAINIVLEAYVWNLWYMTIRIISYHVYTLQIDNSGWILRIPRQNRTIFLRFCRQKGPFSTIMTQARIPQHSSWWVNSQFAYTVFFFKNPNTERNTHKKLFHFLQKSSPFQVETQPCQPQVTEKKTRVSLQVADAAPPSKPWQDNPAEKNVVSSTNMVIWLVVST